MLFRRHCYLTALRLAGETASKAANVEILRERVRAGLAHARQNGKRLGRPATVAVHADRIRKLHRSGLSKSAIARRLHIGRTSVRRILEK
jgi:DNA invertase Pin-like site-specific DNA recombinase